MKSAPAVLKTIGSTQRQLAATIARHATVAVIIGIAASVRLGTALGRWLWILFARKIHAVPEPTVWVGTVIVVTAGTLVQANLIAALPGRAAARARQSSRYTRNERLTTCTKTQYISG